MAGLVLKWITWYAVVAEHLFSRTHILSLFFIWPRFCDLSCVVVALNFFILQVCFLPGTLALGATKGITKRKALETNLLTDEDIENLQLAEDLAKTCVEMYFVTSTGLAPEIAYFHIEVNSLLSHYAS